VQRNIGVEKRGQMPLTYNPEIFSIKDLEQARRIILTAESSTTDERWKTETPMVAELVARHNDLGPGSLVLDYGCGIGRMAKELIERHNCRVIGIDISQSMRALSVEYVNSDSFFACPPGMLNVLVDRGLRFDAAISIWVLQHCLKPADDIGTLRRAVKPGGGLLVLNNVHRAVPTRENGWANDGIDIRKTLGNTFVTQAEETLFSPVVPSSLSGITFWAAYRNGPG
jgi:SAM-dependent methyltransferase